MDRIDKYEILEPIGSGGMGAVYKALHPQFKKYIAIKEIRSELSDNLDIQRRFEREAELLARLPPHPNIVTVRDALVWRGRLYLVMDYIEGGTLKALIEQGGVTPERGAAILEQILAGLEAIHARGIVHRDLKSSNILLDREGTAYLTDFGIAELVAKPSGATPMATARYAAPEIIDARLRRKGDERQADIYAAGVLAYEMFLGEAHFQEMFPEVYTRLPGSEAERWLNWHTDLARRAPTLSDIDPRIPAPLAAIVEQMMAKNMEERYQTVTHARRDLTTWMWGDEQARYRRSDGPPDDATLPVDRMRTGARRTDDRRAYHTGRLPSSQNTPEPPHDPAPLPRGPEKRPPVSGGGAWSKPWTKWAAMGAALLVVLAFVLLSAIGGQPGFTLDVRGAPRGSVVYVGGNRVGVLTTDGTIRAYGLRAGSSIPVSVRFGGGECDGPKSVSGSDGELRQIEVQCKGNELSDEIDYGGPMRLVLDEGDFLMGDNNHLDDERPQFTLRIPSYYIDKYEVTNARYLEFAKATNRPLPAHPWFQEYIQNNPNSPVIGISWNDAKAYADWAHKELPSEQQWEKAASWNPKEKKKYQYPWGDDAAETRAQVRRGDVADSQPASVLDSTGDISPYGVQGMAGGASEWVNSIYDPYRPESPAVADYGQKFRVVRGGSFVRQIDTARTTYRDHHPPDEKAKEGYRTVMGFRCAISADDPKLKEYLRGRGPSK